MKLQTALVVGMALVCAPRLSSAEHFAIIGPEVEVHGRSSAVTVLFNPKEYSISKSVQWEPQKSAGLDAPTLEFAAGEPFHVQFELFFDKYEGGKSVRQLTDEIEKLAIANPKTGRPPLVRTVWGETMRAARLLSVRSEFTAFHRDGTPSAVRLLMHWSYPFGVDHHGPKAGEMVPARIQFGGDIATLAIHPEEEGGAQIIGPEKPPFVQVISLDAAAIGGHQIHLPQYGGSAARLVLPLVFDTTASGSDVSDLVADLVDVIGIADCSGKRRSVLMEINGRQVYAAGLASAEVRYSMFLPDGNPVRATMQTIWKEFSPAEEQLKGTPRH